MTPQEELMDSVEADIMKAVTDARNTMYQRMSAEAVEPNKITELKYLLRYTIGGKTGNKLIRPEFKNPIVSQAIEYIENIAKGRDYTFRVFDAKSNLIFSK